MKEIINRLKSGNKLFVAGDTSQPRYCEYSSTSEQKPVAVVITCSDSRVPVEHIFDVKIGELFVIRNAGNVVSHSVLSSIQYAVEVLNVQTVIVMGHTSCGAISATRNMKNLKGELKDYIYSLSKELSGCTCDEEASIENVKVQADKIRRNDLECSVHEAIYYMDRGVVEFR